VLLRFIWPELPATVAGILPVGFEGGHGTAAAMADVFENNGFSAGKDLALTSATFGILGAVIFGMVLVNWATRKGYTVRKKDPESISEDDSIGIIPVDRRPEAGKLTVNSDAIESVTLHLAIVGIAILIGFVIQKSLVGIESYFDFKIKILSGFPLFPLCLIGGFIVQFFEQRYDKHKVIDVGLMKRIQNTSLDFLVAAAIATINLAVVSEMLLPLLVLVAFGILWNVFCVVFVARRVLPDAWFERSIAEMGQSMGVTATGLLLLRVVDPEYETPAVDAFAYKQLLHEPIMGGGIWTAAAIPLIFTIGALPVLGISVGAIVIWSVVLLLMGSKK
jgi:ESS family glutamate:Na+ symporter